MTEYDFKGRDKSGITGETTLTREEALVIKKMAEEEMKRRANRDDFDHNEWVYPLGGNTWADLDHIRTKMKTFLVQNQ